MTPVRVLVVDDERPARERLRRLLARDARVHVVGCLPDGVHALQVLAEEAERRDPVQLLFLDVQMPELDGFAVIARLLTLVPNGDIPAVVFVTAHDAFAVRAFESRAVDYLLKPFSDERFQAALDHAIRQVRTRNATALLAEMQALLGRPPGGAAPENPAEARREPVDKIVLKGPDRVRLLPVDQISWIEAEGMYVNIHTRDGAVHLHRSLIRSLEQALDQRRFVRIHRSAIVNIDLISELRPDAHGDYVAVLRSGAAIRVGRRFRDRLQQRLGQDI
jgi:two-component system LytT family response regulator